MKRAFGSRNKFYTSLNVSWENENSVPQRYTENIFIFGQKFLTYNVTILSLRALVCKNQTYRGKGEEFDFSPILMLDRLGYN